MFDAVTFERNTKELKKSFPQVYEWLFSEGDVVDKVRRGVCQNRLGLPDYVYEKDRLLMEDIPLGIYKRWVHSPSSMRNLSIVIGANVGYGIDVLLKKTRDRILVVEPLKEMVAACLGISDLSPFIREKRLAFSPPITPFLPQAINSFLPFIYSSNYRLLLDPSYMKNHRDLEKVVQRIRNSIGDIHMFLNTFTNCQDLTIKNELQNYYKTFRHGSLFPLKGKFSGCYALIVGAGPSLAQFLEPLSRIQEDTFVLTAFQNLPIFFEARISPTLCMALDYSKVLLDVFDRVEMEWLKNIPLIYSPKIRPELVDRYPGIKIPVWTEGGLGTYLRRDRELVIDSGGNVSVALVRLFYELGFREFFLVGQDFAWRGDSTHTRGHHAASSSFEYSPQRHVRLKNLWGDTIYSSHPYLTAVHELEEDLEINRDMTLYNLYGGGVVIKGAINVSWDYLCSHIVSYPQKEELRRFTAEIRRCHCCKDIPFFQGEFREWKRSLHSVFSRLKRLFKRPNKRSREIGATYMDILKFLTQHPLYSPYISPEIIEISQMAFVTSRYMPHHLEKTSRLFRRIERKIKEIDTMLQN